MDVTPDTVRQVLKSWLAIEVLSPEVTKDTWSGLAAEKRGQQRNKRTVAANDPAYWEQPCDEDGPPWPLLAEHPDLDGNPPVTPPPTDGEPAPRPWYSVVLGALPAAQAFRCLDAAFSDRADEDETNRHTTGSIIAASLVLDEWGRLVADTLAIASFAWGLGRILSHGPNADLTGWDDVERDIKGRFSTILMPMDPGGRLRSLTWRELRAVSGALATELNLPLDLWQVTPCAIRMERPLAPRPDLLSSFLLADLQRVVHDVDRLPDAAAAYLGLCPPAQPWDALTDRRRLSGLLEPGLFPFGCWPGPGLHPLTLLQQAAVNAIVRDLDRGGIASVNGPPGTGKTTLLRDLVAHVMVSRAEVLAGLDDPCADLAQLDLMDYAVAVASSNNAAVENVTLELPIRGKALDQSVWRDNGLDYFGHTANAVLGVPPTAPEDARAWGLMAARLGKAANRRAFFEKFWWDPDWGLNDWLNLAGWPDAPQNRDKPLGKLAILDPPPRWPEARANWEAARDEFRLALDHCQRLRAGLEALAETGARLRQIEAQIPSAERRLDIAERDLASALHAAGHTRQDNDKAAWQETIEAGKLAALSSVAPARLAKLFRIRAWKAHEAGIRDQVARLSAAQAASRNADARLASAATVADRCSTERQAALAAHDALRQQAGELTSRLQHAERDVTGAIPGPGFWTRPDSDLYRAAPWNHGEFRAARDRLFTAAVRLHHAFILVAVRTVKPSLNAIARAATGAPDAPMPTATDWGVFFLVVPVVSTTFASVGRMFRGFGAAEIGWLLIDEAGQAAPQAAMGAIWRARRAVVIGDPLQIEPVVTTPHRTTRLLFAANQADPDDWAAPNQSAQTLADRASQIQGRFGVANGDAERQQRITGIPLLVHRRCEQPMFGIANAIAYDGRMVFATPDGDSPIRDILGQSAWIDIDEPSSNKWVEAEGRIIAAAITQLCERLPQPPDLYVICPFKIPAASLKALLLTTPGVLPRLTATAREEWIERRVGTVHTFQGKEAEAVIMMLGAGRGARAGARSWAGRTPNLLNVAATRAKRALYIVGNRAEWEHQGVFAHAARTLSPPSPHTPWCAPVLLLQSPPAGS